MNYHPFNDQQGGTGDQGRLQNILHAMRGGVMGGNEYRVQNMPRGSVYDLSGRVIPSGVATVHLFDTVEYDTDGVFTTATGAAGCKTPGVYIFNASVTWPANGVGFRQSYLIKNAGAQQFWGANVTQPGAGNGTWQFSTAHILMNAGDTVQHMVAQTSGGNLTTDFSSAQNRLSVMTWCMVSTL